MISKIIQKEKERQNKYLKGCGEKIRNECVRWYKSEVDDVEVFINICGEEDFICEECCYKSTSHNESLINLKEDREEQEEFLDNLNGSFGERDKLCIYCRVTTYTSQEGIVHKEDCIILKLRADIKELNKMIERYE